MKLASFVLAAAAKAGSTVAPKLSKDSPLLKPQPISPALKKFLGTNECSRPDAVKKLWEYIKAHKLQSEADKRVINCDEKLKSLLGKDKVGMLEVGKLISSHFPKKA